jgi:hypothetical protein
MAEEVVATFEGPLDSFSITLSINNSSTLAVRTVGISGRTAKFPVTWDSFGTFSGAPVIHAGTTGLDTEVVLLRFTGFDNGKTVKFTGVDPDFTGDTSSGIRVLDLVGSRATAFFADGTTGFGEFEVTDKNTVRAVITRP